ncbi:hypothetical protein ACA910_021331 [Epithemia clementina (nom. ined.)]
MTRRTRTAATATATTATNHIHSNNPEFYESLNGALEALEETRTIELELKSPLHLEQVRALSFRLLRRGRVDHVQTLKLRCCFSPQQAEQCMDVLEHLIQHMRHLESLFLSNVTYGPDCHRFLRGCNTSTATLRRLALGCETTNSRDCITPQALAELRNPCELEKLGLGYICSSQMNGFVQAFSTMTNLRELGVGLGQGTNDLALQAFFQCVLHRLDKVQGLYLWGPDAAEFQLTSAPLAGLARLLRKGLLDVLSLEDLPSLFECRSHPVVFQDCMFALSTCPSLVELVLEGDLGLGQEAAIAIFKALEQNTKLRRFHIEINSLAKCGGWDVILASLAKNTHLSDLCLKTNTSTENDNEENADASTSFSVVLAKVIEQGLRKNIGIVHFSCFINSSWHFCSHSSAELHAVSKRNRSVAMARTAVPCDDVVAVTNTSTDSKAPKASPAAVTTSSSSSSMLSTNLLPRATEQLYRRGGHSPVFLLIQNFAAKLVESLPSKTAPTSQSRDGTNHNEIINNNKRKHILSRLLGGQGTRQSPRRRQVKQKCTANK